VKPGKVGGHRKRVLEPDRAFIQARISHAPHLTQHGLKGELAARRLCVAQRGLAIPAARGAAVQKTLLALEQTRSDVARRRRRWRSWQASLDPGAWF